MKQWEKKGETQRYWEMLSLFPVTCQRQKKKSLFSLFFSCFSHSRALLTREVLILNLYSCSNPTKCTAGWEMWAGDRCFIKPLPEI